MSLTPAGRALLPYARGALAQVDHGREAVAALRGLVTGRLAVGLVLPLPDRRVVRAVGAFQRRHPGIDVVLVEDETDALLAALAAGEVEAAFLGLGLGQQPPEGLESVLVAREPAVLAVPAGHPLAARSTARLTAIRDEPIVTLTAASRLRAVLEAACREAGFAPRVVAETSDVSVMLELVAERVGVALVPESGLHGVVGVAGVTVSRPKIERRIVLAWRPAATPPAARAFIALARDELAA